jgi:hydroxylamine reductase
LICHPNPPNKQVYNRVKVFQGVLDKATPNFHPFFITPNILKVLVEKFNTMPIKTPEEDLKSILK